MGTNLWITEEHINKDKNRVVSTVRPYRTSETAVQELFLSLQKIYGRCTSKLYLEEPTGESHQIGWKFETKTFYQDSDKTYTQETLIEVWVGSPDNNIRPFRGEGKRVPNSEIIGYSFTLQNNATLHYCLEPQCRKHHFLPSVNYYTGEAENKIRVMTAIYRNNSVNPFDHCSGCYRKFQDIAREGR